MKKYKLLLAALMLSFYCFGKKQVYVSTSGNDNGNGTIEHPFLTIEKARDDIRLMRVLEERKPDTCYISTKFSCWEKFLSKDPYSILIRGGDYYFPKTLELGSQDNNLIIAPYEDEKVRFTGGISIDPAKAKPVAGSDKENIFPSSNRSLIYMLNLKELGITNYGEIKQTGFIHPRIPTSMELIVNGVPGHLARWPNDSAAVIGKVLDKGSVAAEGDTGTRGGTFTYSGDRPSGWKTTDDIWIFGYFNYGWADDVVKLASINTSNNTFTTVQPHYYGYSFGSSWNTWYAFNILEEIDAPGEYYIDRNEGILYFYNPGNLKQLEVSILESPLIAMYKSSGISIQGISLECARGIGMSMNSTDHCLLQNCTISSVGLNAVTISDSDEIAVGKKNGIVNCSIFQTGAGGVELLGGNRKTLEAAGNYVENCSIYDYNRINQTYCAGVHILGVGNRIANCEIYNAPHCAILLGGNDHLIEYNNIHDVCRVTDDVGALYYGRNPSERGLQVRYNYFHNISEVHRCSAVYHDDGACGMSVFGNIFYKAGSMPVLIGGGSDNSYVNNIFIDCPLAIHVDDRLLGWAKDWVAPGGYFEQLLNDINYSQSPYSDRYPELAIYWEDKPALPKRNVIDKNVFVRIPKVVEGGKQLLEYSRNNYETNEDPGFENEQTQNFKLKSSSEIFRKIPGFQSIPFEKIGIQ